VWLRGSPSCARAPGASPTASDRRGRRRPRATGRSTGIGVFDPSATRVSGRDNADRASQPALPWRGVLPVFSLLNSLGLRRSSCMLAPFSTYRRRSTHASPPDRRSRRKRGGVSQRPARLREKFTEPVALSSTQPTDVPLPRSAARLSLDLVALRARCDVNLWPVTHHVKTDRRSIVALCGRSESAQRHRPHRRGATTRRISLNQDAAAASGSPVDNDDLVPIGGRRKAGIELRIGHRQSTTKASRRGRHLEEVAGDDLLNNPGGEVRA
jgi:hypothetical protein